jgi:multisubunit Na+/H+ antiporter MnhG subunit
MIRQVVTDVLLAMAVLTVGAAALGVALMPDAYTRLHYVTPAAVVAPVLVALAVFVTVIALAFLVAASPFLSHATVRAIRVRQDGDWRGRDPGVGPGGPDPAGPAGTTSKQESP